MTPADKQRVRDAFQKAFDRDPVAADLPIEGWRGREGVAHTSRELFTLALSSDEFFNRIDQKIAAGEHTLDQYLRDFETTRMPVPSRTPRKSGWTP